MGLKVGHERGEIYVGRKRTRSNKDENVRLDDVGSENAGRDALYEMCGEDGA